MADATPTPDDDDFWFQRAASIVLGTSDKLIAGAERISVAMVWFWTVYTAAALVITASTDQFDRPGYIILLVVPAVLLFAAYLSAAWAALPIEITFDDRRPDQIKGAHDAAVAKRWSRLKFSVGLAGAAAVAITAMVITGALLDEKTDDAVSVAVAEGKALLIAGHLGGVNEVTVHVSGESEIAVERVVPVLDDEFSVTIDIGRPGRYTATIRYERGAQVVAISEDLDVSSSE